MRIIELPDDQKPKGLRGIEWRHRNALFPDSTYNVTNPHIVTIPCCELRQGSPMDTAEPLESPVKTDYEVTSPRRPRYARPQEGNEKQSHNKISPRRSPRLAAAEHLVESLRLHHAVELLPGRKCRAV